LFSVAVRAERRSER
jgi:hypothetical protein